jgi:hypothetical protein
LDFTYLIFGLQVRSNCSLPGLQTATAALEESDITLHFGDCPPSAEARNSGAEECVFVSSLQEESGEPALRIWKTAGSALRRMDYADGTRFWVEARGRQVWAQWAERSSLEDAASYLLGPVFGFLLRLRGITCLHASAVQCGDRAIAFVGAEGAGKSTTAAALALRGHAVVSDDIVALTEEGGSFYAAPAYPYLSLWPDAAEALCGRSKSLASFSRNFSKRMLPVAGSDLRFAGEPVLLDSIFLLGPRSGDAAAPFVETTGKREALMSLVADSYANLLLSEEMRAREFAVLGRLVGTVPTRRLCAHEDTSRIGSLCDLIEREIARPKNAAPAAPVRP